MRARFFFGVSSNASRVRARFADMYARRAITLTKNSQFYVRQGDVERLIAQGYLQRLT